MNVNKKALFTKIYEKIKAYDLILLFRHELPDPDALGSVFGLREIIKHHFPDKKVLVLGNDKIINEKLFPQNDSLIHIPKQKFLAIICDTANEERIDGKFWRSADYIIKIDHHPILDKSYAHLDLVFAEYSSTCELICEFARAMKLDIPKQGAKYLYTGIVTDTGRFLYPGVDDKTFSIASYLLKTKIDINAIYEKLYMKNIKSLKFMGGLINNIKFHNQTMSVFIDKEMLKKYDSTPEEAKFLINVMSGYKKFPIWVMAIEKDDHIKISLRSQKDFHVNKIAMLFKGGGHNNAAACKIYKIEDLTRIINHCDQVKIKKEV